MAFTPLCNFHNLTTATSYILFSYSSQLFGLWKVLLWTSFMDIINHRTIGVHDILTLFFFFFAQYHGILTHTCRVYLIVYIFIFIFLTQNKYLYHTVLYWRELKYVWSVICVFVFQTCIKVFWEIALKNNILIVLRIKSLFGKCFSTGFQ